MKKYIVILVGLYNVAYAAESGSRLSRSCPDYIVSFEDQNLHSYFKNCSQRLSSRPLSDVKIAENYPKHFALAYRAAAKKKGLSVSQ